MLYFIKIKPPATGIRGCVWKRVKLILRVTLCNLVLILRVTSNVRWSRQMPSCRQKTWKKFATAFVFTGQNCVHRVMLLWNFFFGGWNSYPENLGGSRSFSGWRVELCQERDTVVMTISMAWVGHSPLLSPGALYSPVARSAAGEKNPGRLEIRAPTSAGKQRVRDFASRAIFKGEVYLGGFVSFSFVSVFGVEEIALHAWAMLFLKWQLRPAPLAPML